jgi:hypothetical protein
LQKISEDPAISAALFKVLETQNIIAGQASITLVPHQAGLIGGLLATEPAVGRKPKA